MSKAQTSKTPVSGLWALAPGYEDEARMAIAQMRNNAPLVPMSAADVAWGTTFAPWEQAGSEVRIPVRGVLLSGVAMTTPWFTGYEYLEAAIARARNDETIERVVFVVNSPGGEAGPVASVAEAVAGLADEKIVEVEVRHLMASAAYIIMAPAAHIAVTPTAVVGSIGVITEMASYARMLDEAGVDVAVVSAGKWKDSTSYASPLDEGAVANMQQMIDDMYDVVVGVVADGRGISRDVVVGRWGAGLYAGERAVRVGLADAVIAATTDPAGGVVQDQQEQQEMDDMTDDTEAKKRRKDKDCAAKAPEAAGSEAIAADAAVQLAAIEKARSEAREEVLAAVKALMETEAVANAGIPAPFEAGMKVLLGGGSAELATETAGIVARAVGEQPAEAKSPLAAAMTVHDTPVDAAADDEAGETADDDPVKAMLASYRRAAGVAG